jgi:Glycosyl transferase family 2
LHGVPRRPHRLTDVTVVVPAYNYARYLLASAGSVLGQPHVNVQLVIVDDCSTDETPQVAAALAACDSRVTVVRNEANLGHVPSVNYGLSFVDSEYVVKLDADDVLAPGALARATALLEAHPEVSFVDGRPRHFSGSVPAQRCRRSTSWTVWSGREWVAQCCRSGNNAISQPEVVMRTEQLRSAGVVASELPHTSDLNLWLRLASLGDVGRINGPVQGYYRVHDQSMQRTVHAGQLFGLRGRLDAFNAAFAAQARGLEDASELHATARRALAAEALGRACHAYDRGYTSEHDEPVDGFVQFALDTWPDAPSLREWRALQRRQAVGAARAPRQPQFFAAAVARRATAELGRWHWLRTGQL